MRSTPTSTSRVDHVPGVMGCSPVVKGTRIQVASLVIAACEYGRVDGVLDAYPHLTAEDVADALVYYLLHRDEVDVDIADLQDESPLEEDDETLDAGHGEA